MENVPRFLAVRNHILCVCVLETVRCVILMCSFHLCGIELDSEVPVQVITKVVPEELVFSLSLEEFYVAEFPSDIYT